MSRVSGEHPRPHTCWGFLWAMNRAHASGKNAFLFLWESPSGKGASFRCKVGLISAPDGEGAALGGPRDLRELPWGNCGSPPPAS